MSGDASRILVNPLIRPPPTQRTAARTPNTETEQLYTTSLPFYLLGWHGDGAPRQGSEDGVSTLIASLITRAVWSGLLVVAAFAAPAGMLASLQIQCSCRNRRSRWSYRLSEPAMEVLKRPEAVSYSYSPWFCRAEVTWCWWPQGLQRGGKQGSRRQRPK